MHIIFHIFNTSIVTFKIFQQPFHFIELLSLLIQHIFKFPHHLLAIADMLIFFFDAGLELFIFDGGMVLSLKYFIYLLDVMGAILQGSYLSVEAFYFLQIDLV